jgi:nucleoid-associated protein Lsr2
VARETITRLVDDLDGSKAEETVKFALDGRSYEIDLSAKNAAKLRAALDVYVEYGTRLSRASATASRGARATASTGRNENQAIRIWAEEQGYEVASRGRISQEIVDLYHQHGR